MAEFFVSVFAERRQGDAQDDVGIVGIVAQHWWDCGDR
jgi:hypothetical protein